MIYTCKHTSSFLLSRCTGPTRRTLGTRKKSKSLFNIYSEQECGPCNKAKKVEVLDERIDALWLREVYGLREEVDEGDDWYTSSGEHEESEELALARRERDCQLYQLDRDFPDRKREKFRTWEKRRVISGFVRCGSTLRVELQPEDADDGDDDDATHRTYGRDDGGWADSSTGWKSLDEELAEYEEAERTAGLDIPVASFGWGDSQRGLDTGEPNDEAIASETRTGLYSGLVAEKQMSSRDLHDSENRNDERLEASNRSDIAENHDPFGIWDTMLAAQ